jgi:hypothetical protein
VAGVAGAEGFTFVVMMFDSVGEPTKHVVKFEVKITEILSLFARPVVV